MIEILINGEEIYAIINGERTSIDNDIIKFNINDEIKDFITELEECRILDVGIKDLYIYDDIEAYNFARGTICNKISGVLSKFLLIEALIEKYGKESIKLYTSDIVYKYICNNIFKVKIYDSKENIEEINKKKKKVNGKIIKRIIKGFIFLYKYKFKKDKNENILFMTQCGAINTIRIGEKSINYDSQYGEVIELLRNEKHIFRMQYLNNIIALDKSRRIGDDFFPFENFLLMKKTIFKKKLDDKKLIDKLYLLKDFNFSFHNRDVYNLLDKFVFSNIKELFNSYIYEIYASEKLLKLLNISKVISVDEADRARCLIYSANKLNIPTFAIQHGIITKASVSYFIPTNNNIYIPRKTFVWGEEFKEVLLKDTKIYNNDNTVVVGQPRTDYLYNKLQKEKINKNKDGKLKILYATQYIKELAREATEFLFSSLSQYEKEYEIIIKLHPNDNYYDMYYKIAKEYNISNIKITKEIDIYDAILWSDVVISVHSTVNLESAILNKPSICLLLKKYWDQGNFVKNNISKGVSNNRELLNSLNDISWELNRSYIEKNFYKVDGLVGNRIKNIINSY